MIKNKISTLIVDDEPLVRERIRELLKENSKFEVAEECANGEEAINAINNHNPDLVFLDVQMPVISGLEVANYISEETVLVFVTAYDEYTMEAFKAQAIDYLLKPFDKSRFDIVVSRVKKAVEQKRKAALGDELINIAEVNEKSEYRKRFTIKEKGLISFINTDDIEYMEVKGNYVHIMAAGQIYKLRSSIKLVQETVSPEIFFRIHRAVIVNLEFIKEMEHIYKGDYRITMTSGKHFSTSHSYREQIIKLLNIQ